MNVNQEKTFALNRLRPFGNCLHNLPQHVLYINPALAAL